MKLIHALHPRAIAIVAGPLALGAAYFLSAAPPATPGAYVLTPVREAYALPARRTGELPSHRPEYFYLLDPERYEPPLNPQSARLALVAQPADAASSAPTQQVGIDLTVTEANPHLFALRSPQLDGPWIREQFEDLSRRSQGPLKAVLVLTVAPVGGGDPIAFGLALDRLW